MASGSPQLTPSSLYAHPCDAGWLQPVEHDILRAGGVTEGHWHTCLSRTKEHTLCEAGTGKDLPTQGNQLDTGSVGSYQETVQIQGAFLCGREEVKRLHVRLPFSAVFQQVNVAKCSTTTQHSWVIYSLAINHSFSFSETPEVFSKL